MLHSVLSNNLPYVYPCPEIGNFFSALIMWSLVMSVFPKYVVLRSVLPSNIVPEISVHGYLHICQSILP